ncbi:MAG: glycosyltransferase family 9 protein [Candidatus Krumholzibacteriota bacterium]|nr:glycosyltransferase family 9 protein [Candidatus Krumholzibacteriota bacterium]
MPAALDPPFRAALLAPSWLGDSVMATALPPLLAARCGGPVEVWARPAWAPLFQGAPDVDRVLIFDPKGAHHGGTGLRRWRRQAAAAGDPARAVWILPDSLSAALAAWAAGTPRRVGRAATGRSLLLTDPVRDDAPRRQRHWIAEQADLLRAGPGRTVDGPGDLSPRVAATAEASQALEKKLDEMGVSPYDCCVYVAGATYGPAKRWPGFAALGGLLPPGLTLLLVGAASERDTLAPLARDLVAAGRSCRVMAGALSIPELAALLRAARFTVANDTGPMHLAAAVGGRVLGLFCSTSPAWTAPVGPQARWLDAGAGCAPCFRRRCPEHEARCLAAIAPQRVLAALGDWLEAAP